MKRLATAGSAAIGVSSSRRSWLLATGLALGSMGTQAGLPEIIQASKPAVVLVGTYAETDNPRFQFRGSGFVVGDGLTVVTAAHVLPDPVAATPTPTEAAAQRQLVVMLWQGGSRWLQRDVEVRGISRSTDLALLKLSGAPAPRLTLAGHAALAEGSDIALIGFPIGGVLGFSHVTHRGTISAVTQLVPPQSGSRQLTSAAVRQLRDSGIDIYQLDALAYPGNSGGPVIDLRTGAVVGVLSLGLARAGREGALSAPTGISYAIPVMHVHELLAR